MYLVPSEITVNPQAELVPEGGTLILSCEATGSSPIKYQWRRVNGEISSDRAEGVNTSTLTISPVMDEDEDKYYCVASNDVKDESKTAVVAVISRYTGTDMTCVNSNIFISLCIGELEGCNDDNDCGSQTIIIAVLSVLLAVAIVCIVGLVIWIVQLHKTHAQAKSKEK